MRGLGRTRIPGVLNRQGKLTPATVEDAPNPATSGKEVQRAV